MEIVYKPANSTGRRTASERVGKTPDAMNWIFFNVFSFCNFICVFMNIVCLIDVLL